MMKIAVLAVLAVLVRNGNGDCSVAAMKDVQNCQSKMMDGLQGIQGGSESSKNRRGCCLVEQFQDCVSTAIKSCGPDAETAVKGAIQGVTSQMGAPCSNYPDACSGGSSIVPMNAVLMCVLMYLGYFVYVNKF